MGRCRSGRDRVLNLSANLERSPKEAWEFLESHSLEKAMRRVPPVDFVCEIVRD